MSQFDPDAFMSAPTSEAGSTTFAPVPTGEYTAIIEDVAKPRSAGERVVMDVTFKMVNVDQKVLDSVGRAVLNVKKGYFLDLTPENRLDMSKGKNIDLNRLREAVGQNVAGKPWTVMDLKGAGPLKVVVSHRTPKDGPSDVIYSDIRSVAKL